MSTLNAEVIVAYRRIRKAYKENRGVRLTADEVFQIWTIDSAISTAVESADIEDQEAKESVKTPTA